MAVDIAFIVRCVGKIVLECIKKKKNKNRTKKALKKIVLSEQKIGNPQ